MQEQQNANDIELNKPFGEVLMWMFDRLPAHAIKAADTSDLQHYLQGRWYGDGRGLNTTEPVLLGRLPPIFGIRGPMVVAIRTVWESTNEHDLVTIGEEGSNWTHMSSKNLSPFPIEKLDSLDPTLPDFGNDIVVACGRVPIIGETWRKQTLLSIAAMMSPFGLHVTRYNFKTRCEYDDVVRIK